MACNLREDEVKRQLNKLNIYFDIDTVKEVHNYLNKYIGSLCESNTLLHIFAAAAIVSQTRKIATIDNKSFTTSGIKVETIMRHLVKGISKEMYLNTIKEHINKIGSQDSALSEKIGILHISLRIFKKYKQIFEQLSQGVSASPQILSNYLAFFWLIFLILKNNFKIQDDNTSQNTTVLITILELAFGNLLTNIPESQILQSIRIHFPSFSQVTQSQKRQLRSKILSEIQEVVLNRTSHFQSFKPENLRGETKLLARLVDDLSNKCDIIYRGRKIDSYIDQMSYLELTKDLTPQCVSQPARPQIRTKINFDNSDDDDDQRIQDQFTKTEKKQSRFEQSYQESEPRRMISTKLDFGESEEPTVRIQSFQVTPVTMTMQTQQYMKQIERKSAMNQQKIKSVFLQYNINPESFTNECQKKIQNCMNEISPNSRLREGYKSKILKNFIQYTLEINKKLKQAFLSTTDNFFQILCATHYLYDVSIKFTRFKFRQYCKNYSLNLTDCAKVICYIGQNCQLPDVMKNNIKQIQTEIYIIQIWQDNTGYQILLNQQKAQNQILIKRLKFHISQRIKSICEQTKIQLRIIKKIQPLVTHIITEKRQLLEFNKIDQIIICSITACLNLNLPNHSHALQTIFSSYNNVQFSSNWMSEQLYGQGQRMNLQEFYTTVFVKELSDFMSDINNASKIQFLLTPRKQQHVANLKNDGKGLPLFAQNSPIGSGMSHFSASKNNSSNNFNSFKKNVQQKIFGNPKKIIKQREQNLLQSPGQSPRFGGISRPTLQRKFTFGEQN